ncbi:hypothetical protein B566_EDAN015692, partial [Ephemera danica]
MTNDDMFRCKKGKFRPGKKLKLEANPTPHEVLHEALISKDCGTVCHLLEAGEKLCSTDGLENCFVLITKFFNFKCLEHVLTSQPSAIHCRGPRGQTLLMYAKHMNMMETLFQFEPDVNACNDRGENVLMHLIQLGGTYINSNNALLFYKCMLMARCVLDRGININATIATDTSGKTAMEHLLDMLGELSKNTYIDTRQVAELFEELLKAGATVTPRDEHGRTFAMQIARKVYIPQLFKYIIDLLEQGVDPKARDNDGKNLMFYVLSSHQKIHSETRFPWFDVNWDVHYGDFAQRISEQCLTLLHYGCELGGLDIIFDVFRHHPRHNVYGFRLFATVHFNVLSLVLRFRPFSDFCRKLPELNLCLSTPMESVETSVSELTCYFMNNLKWPMDDETFEMVDATVAHLLASGVNVMQHVIHNSWRGNHEDQWLANLKSMNIKKKDVMKAYHISCKILISLLRFWAYPPLALLLFKIRSFKFECDFPKSEEICVLTMLKFLTRVGGRLPPGSQLFKCLKQYLETEPNHSVPNAPFQLFSKLHEEIPSLREMCRSTVRATLSKVTTSGLDLSSLRVLCSGELREIPREIEDYLNFKNQPEFCENDLAEFEGN